jgi:hypothetical protein
MENTSMVKAFILKEKRKVSPKRKKPATTAPIKEGKSRNTFQQGRDTTIINFFL